MDLKDIEHFEDYLLEHGAQNYFLFVKSTLGEEFTAWKVNEIQGRKQIIEKPGEPEDN
jgi:hypothetical protein